MENFAREGPKIRMATIFATNSGNSLSPVCTTRKLLQAVQNCFRWIGMGLVLSKRFADDSLNYPFLMGNVGAHTYIYAQGLPFACNLKEKRGKGGLVPPNNRFERTRGTSPLAAQPNVRPKREHDKRRISYDFRSMSSTSNAPWYYAWVIRAFLWNCCNCNNCC